MSTNPKTYLTPEEYLEFERGSAEKHEYYNGEIFAMGGASARHNTINFNTGIALGAQLKGTRCRGYANDQRVKIPATELYTYPDLVIVCGEPVFEHGDTLTNPTLIVEVLSPSTESYDRGEKFDHYRKLSSLAEYLLVAQSKCHIIHYARQSDHTWLLTEYDDLKSVISLPAINCRLALADVYDRVEFGEEAFIEIKGEAS